MSKVLVIGGHGIGDCMMAFQCATVLQWHGIQPKVIISARDEVFNPIKQLLGALFDLEQIDESYAADNNLLKDASLMAHVSKGYDEVYYVIPDLLFNNRYAFDYKKYHTNPQMIRDIKLLEFTLPANVQRTNIIYLGLMTTTDGYMYSEPMSLALSLAYALPEYQIYFPVVNTWAGKMIKAIDVPNTLPNNLEVPVNPYFEDTLDILSRSCYFVGTDNGPSHIAYHLGMPRLLLDPQFNRLPWVARWREDYLESIPISSSIDNVTSIVKTNLTIPQTTLVPRMTCLVNGEANWKQLLWLKEQ
jgi:hypothetical protein